MKTDALLAVSAGWWAGYDFWHGDWFQAVCWLGMAFCSSVDWAVKSK